MSEQAKAFGPYIRDKRVAKGYSLRRFAEIIDVSPTYLSHVEQGKVDSPPTAKMVRRIAESLGENVDELTAMAGRVPEDLPGIIQEHPEDMPALLRAAKGLTPEQLKQLMEKAKTMHRGKEGT